MDPSGFAFSLTAVVVFVTASWKLSRDLTTLQVQVGALTKRFDRLEGALGMGSVQGAE